MSTSPDDPLEAYWADVRGPRDVCGHPMRQWHMGIGQRHTILCGYCKRDITELTTELLGDLTSRRQFVAEVGELSKVGSQGVGWRGKILYPKLRVPLEGPAWKHLVADPPVVRFRSPVGDVEDYVPRVSSYEPAHEGGCWVWTIGQWKRLPAVSEVKGRYCLLITGFLENSG